MLIVRQAVLNPCQSLYGRLCLFHGRLGVGDAVAVGEGLAVCVAVAVAVGVGMAVGSDVGDEVAVGEGRVVVDVTSGALSSHAVMTPISNNPKRVADVGRDQLAAIASSTLRSWVAPPLIIRLSWEAM